MCSFIDQIGIAVSIFSKHQYSTARNHVTFGIVRLLKINVPHPKRSQNEFSLFEASKCLRVVNMLVFTKYEFEETRILADLTIIESDILRRIRLAAPVICQNKRQNMK